MRKTYALFDFDGTLIDGDSIVRFCHYAYRQGLCTKNQLAEGAGAAALYAVGLKTAEQSKMAALAFIVGKSEGELRALSSRFYREALRPRLRREGLVELEARRKSGPVLLLTASPSFYLEPLKEELGLEAVIGTRMDMGPDGKATGLICGENCKGLQKPLRLAEYLAAQGDRLDYDTSYAYGDSLSDLPMLDLCGHKVAVNPGLKLRRKLENVEGAAFVRWKGGR